MTPSDTHPSTTPPPPVRYWSATEIARHLGRSHKAVIRAIARMNIPADALLPAGKGYLVNRIDEIAAGMRRKNGEETPA